MLIVNRNSNISLRPDNCTFPLLFKTCARLVLLYMGHEILGHVQKMGYDCDIFVHNALIHLLVSCGELDAAGKVFGENSMRDLVSWNSLINGYVKSGKVKDALRMYKKMERERDVNPDEVTMIGMVSASAQLEDLRLGKEFHQYIREKGLNMSIPLANALMDMRLFYEMPEKDVVPWNASIGAYVQAKSRKEALSLFHEMQAMNVNPDEVHQKNMPIEADATAWEHCLCWLSRETLEQNVAKGWQGEEDDEERPVMYTGLLVYRLNLRGTEM
ncbi:unnamed protein product [Fraxinus pennsylvanica]|uniref:Pentatricopeptide repeat-containing protein n=1 Tax=Fraxinus pennsylvanica TaxID=56036 RepID=A0AAD1Z1W7_9LAMI|nr:unnamed protein product [Fraxinus pennsylvanica]